MLFQAWVCCADLDIKRRPLHNCIRFENEFIPLNMLKVTIREMYDQSF